MLSCRAALLWLALGTACNYPWTVAYGQDYDQAPIRYSQTQPSNRVSKLLAELESEG